MVANSWISRTNHGPQQIWKKKQVIIIIIIIIIIIKDLYHIPVNDFTQKENDSLYFSSIDGQCKWPSQERKKNCLAKKFAAMVT